MQWFRMVEEVGEEEVVLGVVCSFGWRDAREDAQAHIAVTQKCATVVGLAPSAAEAEVEAEGKGYLTLKSVRGARWFRVEELRGDPAVLILQ